MLSDNYDKIVSLGSQCNPALFLKSIKKKEEAYPFDWVRSNSKIVYDIILNGSEKYTTFNNKINDNKYYVYKIDQIYTRYNFPKTHINSYGQHFTHYKNVKPQDMINTNKRKYDRFDKLLKSKQKVLFIHTHEEYMYDKSSRDNADEFYEYLCKINDLLSEKYPQLNFTIINVEHNLKREDYKHIKNYNMKYRIPYTDNGETHRSRYWIPYRGAVNQFLMSILFSK